MATYLYRLGRTAYRRRRLVVTLWVVALALVGVGAATLSGQTSDEFSIPGTESQQAIDLLDARMPAVGADKATARVVFTVPDGALTDPGREQAIGEVVDQLTDVPQVTQVSDPFTEDGVSTDGRTAYAQVAFSVQSAEVTDEARDALFAVADTAEDAGIKVEYGGSAVEGLPEQSATEIIGLGVAAVTLVITFGSLVAAGLPLLTALLGVMIGIGTIQIATGFIDLSSSTSTLALMLGLAVGIDYALFVTSRYRHELSEGLDGEEAAGRAVGTAGSAVVFAGLTVVIALAALAVVGIPFLTAMGLAAAGTVAVAVVIALTLLPAVFGFAGQRIVGGGIPGLRTPDPENDSTPPTMGERWARLAVRRRWPAVVVAVFALGLAAVPATDLRLALPDDSTAASDTTQRKAYDQLSAGFGPGFNGPLLLVVDGAGSPDPKAAADKVAATVTGLPGVAAVSEPTFNETSDTATLSVIPTSGPSEPATEDLVHAIRGQSGALAAATGATTSITGQTAVTIDVSEKLGDALIPYLVVVVGLAFVLLVLVFRSLLVPLKATAGFLLSVIATFGAVVAVFQWGWLADLLGVDSTGPIVSILPIFLIGVLFGLAMDYEVFLVTRMREEFVHGLAPDDAVISGFRHGARVVTAAAIIMISVFAGFILSEDAIIKSMGFALAFGVLVDAFIVRMTLVPAVMSLLGRRAWWLPGWLDRHLPDIDVEGKKLLKPAPATGEGDHNPALAPDGATSPPAQRGSPAQRATQATTARDQPVR
ncbi:MMPL family transporter [Parafrankia sp. FMc2]|uniref:MMPL family transporter n=1 Tax=Parafrankia sp. FMc2 TaxID=3233196 RepID=UPI0034D71AF3